MPAFLSGINAPLLENANEYVVHGFTYNNYLTELNYADTTSCITSTVLGGQLGANVGCPTENIYFKSNIDAAMLNAHKNARNFVMSMGYNEDAATTMITTAADFGITQIVDGNWGVHCSIPKYIFSGSETTAYTQATTCGGSIPAESMPKPLAAITTQHLLAANASTIHWCGSFPVRFFPRARSPHCHHREHSAPYCSSCAESATRAARASSFVLHRGYYSNALTPASASAEPDFSLRAPTSHTR